MKAKTKRGPMETVATFDETRRGWTFTVERTDWLYSDGPGINLFARPYDQDEYSPIIYAKNLDHAIMFAQGFSAGSSYADRKEAETTT